MSYLPLGRRVTVQGRPVTGVWVADTIGQCSAEQLAAHAGGPATRRLAILVLVCTVGTWCGLAIVGQLSCGLLPWTGIIGSSIARTVLATKRDH